MPRRKPKRAALHALIRGGLALPDFKENKHHYVFDNGEVIKGCALGAAFCAAGYAWDLTETMGLFDDEGVASIAEALDIPRKLAGEIDMMHMQGTPAIDVADWVEESHGEVTAKLAVL